MEYIYKEGEEIDYKLALKIALYCNGDLCSCCKKHWSLGGGHIDCPFDLNCGPEYEEFELDIETFSKEYK